MKVFPRLKKAVSPGASLSDRYAALVDQAKQLGFVITESANVKRSVWLAAEDTSRRPGSMLPPRHDVIPAAIISVSMATALKPSDPLYGARPGAESRL